MPEGPPQNLLELAGEIGVLERFGEFCKRAAGRPQDLLDLEAMRTGAR